MAARGYAAPSATATFHDRSTFYFGPLRRGRAGFVDGFPRGAARADAAEVQEALRLAVQRFFRRETGRRPSVLPVVLEL